MPRKKKATKKTALNNAVSVPSPLQGPKLGEASISEQTKVQGYTVHQMSERLAEKEGIAKYVVNNVIRAGMSIFLDAGSTVHHVGHCLFEDKSQTGLTIMTNNMLVFHEFTKLSGVMSDRGNVLALTGGVYNQNHEALFGQAAEQVLKSFNPKVVVVGASGFMVTESPSDPDDPQGAFHHDLVSEVVTKKAIVTKRTIHRVIVCDYSKIKVWDASCFATIETLALNTEQCTIVTSQVPSDLTEEDKGRFQARYNETCEALKKLSRGKVNMVRVDLGGNVT